MTKRWQDWLEQTAPDMASKLGVADQDNSHHQSHVRQKSVDATKPSTMTMSQRRRLKSGRANQSRLDLHGDTVSEAQVRVQAMIDTMLRAGQRYGLLVHGKGLHSPGGPVLKQAMIDLLARHPQVVAYEQASVNEGGAGATCFLLRGAHA